MKFKSNMFYKIIIIVLLVALIFTNVSNYTQAAVKCKSVKLNVTKGTVGVGEVLSLIAITKPLNATGKQKWISSNKKVAKVTQYGAVTGVKEGTATITVKVNGKKASCKVTVTKFATQKSVDSINQTFSNYENKGTVDSIKKSLASYVTKESVNNLLSEYAKKNSVDMLNKSLSDYSTTKYVDDTLKNYIQSSELLNYTKKTDVYTKEEVDKLINDKLSGIEQGKSGQVNEWNDGTELTMYYPKSLPYDLNGQGTINSFTVKKNHNDGIYNYEYIFNITGKLKNKDDSCSLIFYLVRNDGSNSEGRGLTIINGSSGSGSYTINCTVEEDGSFVCEMHHGGILGDFDKFGFEIN